MMKSVELHANSLVCADPHRRRGQVVVLPSHHQRGEYGGAVGPPPPSRCGRGAMGRLLLAEGRDVSVHHRLDSVHLLRLLFACEGRLEEVLVESAVCHGSVEAADGPDTDGEGLGLQRPADVAVSFGLQLRRRRRAETFRFRLVEPPPLLPPRSLSILHNSCQN